MPADRKAEFPAGAAEAPDEMDRREFLRLAGASLALSGLAGCDRPAKTLVPYVAAPDHGAAGAREFYATAMNWQGYGRGILVESHEGRPTKIEGNPRHSESGGATDAVTQASIRCLYDPARSRSVRKGGQIADWAEFQRDWIERKAALVPTRGKGWALLTEPTTSPTLRRKIAQLIKQFPDAQWHQFSSLPRFSAAGCQWDYDFAAAEVIFSIDADFLGQHPAAVRYGRAFAARRKGHNGAGRMNRLYHLETGRSITGGMADVRLAIAPSRIGPVLAAIGGEGNPGVALQGMEQDFVARVRRDLLAAGPAGVCIAGPEQPEAVHRWAVMMNTRTGAEGRTVKRTAPVCSDTDPAAKPADELLDDLRGGKVHSLVLLGVNPAYASPQAAEWGTAIGRVAYSVHVGQYPDETALRAQWHLPESHYLESWGDLRGFDGSQVIQQPLIEPLHPSRTLIEVAHFLATGQVAGGYELVRETHAVADEVWSAWLNFGVTDAPSLARAPSAEASPVSDAASAPGGPSDPAEVELVLRPDGFLWDGRFASNAWLQELPRPYTSLVWDNALWVSPRFAAEHSLVNNDVIRLAAQGAAVEAPVFIVPGVAEGCVFAEIGGGRHGAGFSVYPLKPSGAWSALARWEKTGKSYPLVTTQHHFSMEGRDPAHVVRRDALADTPGEETVPASLYPAKARPTHAWGMVIDLSSCLGCSACVVACQAENNIPSVGKDAVARGREMHWIRVDRYFGPDDRAVPQPVPCMHCENAPCEAVCPVGATVHSSEGVNEMVYNRCVGTRYCSNNCPYKVRRFNFFDLKSPPGSSLHLQENPVVTVRDRGVMEKCTYCVQRIDAGRIQAERDNRSLRDGDIRTACQQACPAEAIVFGDLTDPSSAVSRRKREKTHYSLLAELNTRPRTTYLARLINP
jgi:Fe-S-cluster-containing dehydrogenase component